MVSTKTCVLGAGLSGISQALRRQWNGEEVCVLEKSNEIGGVLQSRSINGFLLDYSANTLSVRNKRTEEFLERNKILEHAIDANPKSNLRFVVRKGRLIPLPLGFLSFLGSSFLSPEAKLRLLAEPFVPRFSGDSRLESVASFIQRRLGKEALEYGANPFIGGIYASRPESLILDYAFPSLRKLEKKHRSLFWGMLRRKPEERFKSRLVSFRHGMQELPIRLAENLKNAPKLGCSVRRIERLANQKWKILGKLSCGTVWEEVYDQIVCSLPSHALPSIDWINVKRSDSIKDLGQASHPPLSLVFLGFDKSKIGHPLNGFGFLVPEVERMKILGTLFSSSLFPGRAPKDKALLTTFVGGERNPELCGLSDADLISLAIDENTGLLGTGKTPDLAQVVRWPKSIPLPDEHAGTRLAASRRLSQHNRGLVFCGAHLSGAPLPNCMDSLENVSLFD